MTTAPELFDLTHAECAVLLRAHRVGRVAIGTPVGPYIVPVNYAVIEDSTGAGIVFRTAPYSLLGTHIDNAMVAFEVDHSDLERHRGWSVVVRGHSTVIAGKDIGAVRDHFEPGPWAAGTRNLYVRIPFTEVTGRRIGRDWDPLHALDVTSA
ncbi:MAG: pyridoxamine 5'-phosphate oxidase family protein [Nocardioides sp.]